MKRSSLPSPAISTAFSLLALASFTSPVIADSTSITTSDIYFPGDCPALCSQAGPNPANWTHIHSVSDLISCDETVLFDLNVQNDINGPESILTLRACVAEGDHSFEFSSQDVLQAQEEKDNADGQNSTQALLVSTSCGAKTSEISVTAQLGGSAELSKKSSTSSPPKVNDVASAAHNLGIFMSSGAQCGTTILFAKAGSAVVGLYSGAQVTKNAAKGLLNSFVESHETSATQVCSPANAALTVGIYATAAEDLSTAQGVVRSWTNGLCLNGTTASSATKLEVLVSKVQGTNFTAATLPIYRPKPQADGTCNVYNVGPGDGCYDIAHNHFIQQSDIESFNKKTWGWAGCSHLLLGQVICLSTGNPPMPLIIQGTICGPQVPGTQKPASGVDISTLNPCPLNSCCDVWGYCGTTADFCTKTPADTGAPGTTKAGTNGCISNCGMEIVNNGSPPPSFMSVGYFEAFDQERACLRMDVTKIAPGTYTHIHFAFATLTPWFTVDISDSAYQFNKFIKMSGFKKILSFGGWAFSTNAGTFQRFREATKAANRVSFVNSLVDFLNANNLDGLDFDWEYPGAPDIPDITPGSPDEGVNYLAFLILLKSKMPSGKSVSIALPASYWYLRGYPVKYMAAYVDYFIYMTYDLHGQWDVGNKWAIPSCDGGNCLRSHVNKTETHDSLVMLTKAGVSSQKIVVGITSYGRSFRMADPSCSGPFCQYTGDRNHSMAYPGDCTYTPGYIANAEINDIIKNHGKYTIVKSSVDALSGSNILMYGVPGAVDWVAYMDGDTKKDRISWIKGLNFGGTTDWAIDLQTMDYDDYDDDGSDGDGSDDEDGLIPDKCPPNPNPGNLKALADNADSMSSNCAALYGFEILHQQLLDSLDLFQVNSQGYDDKFGWYAKWTKEQIQPRLDAFVNIYKGGKGLQYMTCYYTLPNRSEQKSTCTGMPHFWDGDISWTIRFQLDNEDAFFSDLLSEYGIDKSWVIWGDQKDSYECADVGEGEGPRPGGRTGSPSCRHLVHTRQNIPKKADDDKIQVGNPKELIEASMSNVTALRTSIMSSYLDVGLSFYSDGPNGGSPIDAIVAYSMPIFQMAEAIDSMKDVKDIGEKAKEEAKRSLIFKILSIVFMVIPFVGEALGPIIGSTLAVARIALLVGEAGNAALSVADIIKDPASTPFAILGLIGGAGGAGSLGRTKALEKASTVRGLLKETDLKKFPQRFQDKDALVQELVKKACAH
ncbi:hypothetical protein VE00_11107 [Pseudogymnoascus sp. WSF 3629]|nr:hypothetical protein VE00_11107 [Pseudogymnoascus sp. WSF 3629]